MVYVKHKFQPSALHPTCSHSWARQQTVSPSNTEHFLCLVICSNWLFFMVVFPSCVYTNQKLSMPSKGFDVWMQTWKMSWNWISNLLPQVFLSLSLLHTHSEFSSDSTEPSNNHLVLYIKLTYNFQKLFIFLEIFKPWKMFLKSLPYLFFCLVCLKDIFMSILLKPFHFYTAHFHLSHIFSCLIFKVSPNNFFKHSKNRCYKLITR